jgi:hypothetical protein
MRYCKSFSTGRDVRADGVYSRSSLRPQYSQELIESAKQFKKSVLDGMKRAKDKSEIDVEHDLLWSKWEESDSYHILVHCHSHNLAAAHLCRTFQLI